MELVYLWVEDYKNIKDERFTLSSKFSCEYDNIKKELTIKKNEKSTHLFSSNINITAVVGRNGSGKSNLLISMLDSIVNKEEDEVKLLKVYYCEKKKEYFIDNINTSVLKFNNKAIDTYIYRDNKPFPVYTLHYNYSLDYTRSITKEDLTQAYSEFTNTFLSSPLLLQPSKSRYLISLYTINKEAMRTMLYYSMAYKDSKFQEIDDFFIPVKYKLAIDELLMKELSDLVNPDLYSKLYKFNNQENQNLELEDFKLIHTIQLALYIQKEINNNLLTDIFSEKFEKFQTELQYSPISKEYLNEIINFIQEHNKYEDILDNEVYHIKENFKFFDSNITLFNESSLIKNNEKFLYSLPSWIDIELIDKKNLSFHLLSYGQQFLYNFSYFISKVLPWNNDFKTINLLLDEVELGLHPSLQKKFLNLLINILQKEDKFLFNVILTTHSPFLISDLPRENIIFLENGKQVEGIKKQTFGANIHTLLSDSFFMEDGLMGEFAKGKITEIKDFYEEVVEENKKKESSFISLKEDYEKNKTKFEQIQSIIGEPFLKTVIKNYLDEIENILFDNAKAKKMAIKRFIDEFGEDSVSEVLDDKA